MRSTRTLTLTTALVALPLLAGCGQGGQPAEATTAETSQTTAQTQAAGESEATPSARGTTSSNASRGDATSASPAETRMASAPEATGGQEGAGSSTLPTVADPCAGTCDETTRATVNHPKFGPMEVVAYTLTITPDTAPQGKRASYAVYQNGNPVGYVSSPESSSVISFGNGPAMGDQLWEVDRKNPVDKYGNVYFSSNSGVTVISPSDGGFDSHGTMPGAEDPQYPFQNAGVKIDSSGEPTVVQHVTDKNDSNADTGETVDWTWDSSKFVARK